MGITRNNNYRLACNKGRRMKKYICYYTVVTVSWAVGFIGGIYWERKAYDATMEEITQVAQEACDARIKTIKFACKKTN